MQLPTLFPCPKPVDVSLRAIFFEAVSHLWRFAAEEDGFMVLSGTGPAMAGDASFRIERVDATVDGEIVAPYGCWLRATDIVGFPVTEPGGNTNVYDPTAHDITYVWFLPDEGYTPTITPNIPNAWRTFTRDYGKQIAAVFTTPGPKEITCFAFHQDGTWAFATYDFNDAGGNGPSIRNPDIYFGDARTIYVSNAGNFTDVPAGVPAANRVTSIAAANSRMLTLLNTIGSPIRVRFRRGETWLPQASAGWTGVNPCTYYIDAYGTGNRPKFECDWRGGPWGIGPNNAGYLVFNNLEWEGDWDDLTETGATNALPWNDNVYKGGGTWLISRCRLSGFRQGINGRNDQGNQNMIVFDTEVTNWKDFGFFPVADFALGIVWCDVYRRPGALGGKTTSANGNDNTVFMGNLHGNMRGQPQWLHLSRSSFYNNAGWSSSAGTDFISGPPTAGQPCFRINGWIETGRSYYMMTMNSFEVTKDNALRFRDFDRTNPQLDLARNMVIDKNLFCVNWRGGTFDANYLGFTIRNNYVWTGFNAIGAGFGFDSQFWDGASVTDGVKDQVYNNTVIISNTTPTITSLGEQNATRLARNVPVTYANNVLIAPNTANPQGTGVGSQPDYRPISVSPLAGFTPRDIGVRWGFPPLGIEAAGINETIVLTAQDGSGATLTTVVNSTGRARERETGVFGPVPDWGGNPDEGWCKLPYPDFTGLCNGAGNAFGGPLTQAICEGNSTQRHNVTTSDSPGDINWQDNTHPSSAKGDGRVRIQFVADGIRIQNRTGQTWGALVRFDATGSDGVRRPYDFHRAIFLDIDLSDYLMDPLPGTAPPSTIPDPTFGAGSDAIDGFVSGGPKAWDDFFRNVRSGSVNTTGATVAGTDDLGAVAA